MKGQKLFVRPMEAEDARDVADFLARESPASPVPSTALIGKLVGEVAAVLSVEFTAASVEIRDFVVAQPLRKKRIGRFMIEELYALAAKLDKQSLVMMCDGPADFMKRVGFAREGETMVRRVVR